MGCGNGDDEIGAPMIHEPREHVAVGKIPPGRGGPHCPRGPAHDARALLRESIGRCGYSICVLMAAACHWKALRSPAAEGAEAGRREWPARSGYGARGVDVHGTGTRE